MVSINRLADSCTHFSAKSSSSCRLVPTGTTIRSCARKSSASSGWSSTPEALAAAQAGHAPAGLPPFARRAPAQQRKGAARGLSLDRARRRRRPRHHAGRRMGARQLPRRRGADPRDPRGPAAGLLSPAAQARRRTVRRISARVRHRLGLRRAHRQPLRARDRCGASCAPTRPSSR